MVERTILAGLDGTAIFRVTPECGYPADTPWYPRLPSAVTFDLRSGGAVRITGPAEPWTDYSAPSSATTLGS